MSGFGFSEAQETFRREVRSFVQKELLPTAKERAKMSSIPDDITAKMVDGGFVGLKVSEKYGGQPCDWVTWGIALEELARSDTSIPLAMVIQPLFIYQLLEAAKAKDLAQQWLPSILNGSKRGCYAFTEPNTGSDFAAITTTAIREGDHYVINGEKTSVTRGTNADVCLVFARTGPGEGARGISVILVPLDTPGITRSPIPDMGFLPLGRASMWFDEVRIPVANRIGEEGKGFKLIMNIFSSLRVGVPLICLGAAQASLDEALTYAKQRYAFGHPIGHFQGVSFKLAEDAAYIEAVRMLSYRALWLADQGLPNDKEAAMCKWLGPQVSTKVIHDCMLTHGHIGYSEEAPLEQRLRDVIGYEFGAGTAEIMKVLISRELLGHDVVD